MMKETTRKKLHELATEAGRSDSNMVEYLIDSYGNRQDTVKAEGGKETEKECGKKH